MSSSAVATCEPSSVTTSLLTPMTGARSRSVQFWASGSTMFFCTNRISPVAEKDISRKMTSIVIMSMYATRLSGAYRLLRPACPSLAFATSRLTDL